MQTDKITNLYEKTKKLYLGKEGLFYHGWHHIDFVIRKSLEFSESLNADKFLVESSAILHDTNYLIKRYSKPCVAKDLRAELLSKCDFNIQDSMSIETIINEAHLENRNKNISLEAQALSDADTLFKALPITPILLTHRYLSQTGVSIRKLGEEIINNQIPLMNKGIYFYSNSANENYLKWAETNIQLWENVISSLNDPVVSKLVNELNSIS